MAVLFSAAQHLRAARRTTDLSQRELATVAEVSPSTIARIESGWLRPRVDTLDRILRSMSHMLDVRDQAGGLVHPLPDSGPRDQQGRHYPAHLDTRRADDGWWGHVYGLEPPDNTFDLSREKRDRRRW